MIYALCVQRLKNRFPRMDNILLRRARLLLGVLPLFLLLAHGCQKKPVKTDIMAQVGNSILTRQALDRQIQRDGIDAKQEYQYVERWVNREVLYREAERLGLDKTDELDLELELVRKEFLINKLLERTFQEKALVDEQMMRSYYNKHQDLYRVRETQVHMFHILTAHRESANLARQALLAGQSFDEVAKRYSTGIFKNAGGDMGFVKEDDLIPELRRSAFRIGLEQISPVIRSEYGYHLIKITEKWSKEDIRPYDAVKTEINAKLRASRERQIYYDLVYHLQNQTHVYMARPTASDSSQAVQ